MYGHGRASAEKRGVGVAREEQRVFKPLYGLILLA